MRQHIISFLLLCLGLFFTSCSPYIIQPYPSTAQNPAVVRPVTQQPSPQSVVTNPNQTVSSPGQKEQRQIEQYPPTTSGISAPQIPEKPVPTASRIPGKPGWVYNPYNNNPVLVEGIPSGKKVRDQQDPDESHVFRIP